MSNDDHNFERRMEMAAQIGAAEACLKQAQAQLLRHNVDLANVCISEALAYLSDPKKLSFGMKPR